MAAFGTVLLLGMVSSVSLSNPDSERVQDPSNASQKSAPMIQFDNSAHRILTRPGFRVSTLRDLRQSNASSDMIVMWRKIIPSNYIPSTSHSISEKPVTKMGITYTSSKDQDIVTSYPTRQLLLSQDIYQNPAWKVSSGDTGLKTDLRNILQGTSKDETHAVGVAFVPNMPPSGNLGKTHVNYGIRDSNPSFRVSLHKNSATRIFSGRSRPGTSGYNGDQSFLTSHPDSFRYRGMSRFPVHNPSSRVDPNAPRESVEESLDYRPVSSSEYGTGPIVRVSPDSNFFAGIVNEFSFKMVNALKQRRNFVISPLSIFVALSMCYLGSNGTTQDQLESAMGLNENNVHGPRFHEGIQDLLSQITARTSDYQLLLANGFFAAQTFDIFNSAFVQGMENYYGGILRKLDFSNPLRSAQKINKWVSDRTDRAIRRVFDEPPDPLTRLLLLSAIYFKGVWKTQFPIHQTNNSTFILLDGKQEEIPTMMLYNETFPYYQSYEFKHNFVKIPYRGGKISMIIGVPFRFGQIPMPVMTDQILCSIRDGLRNTRLDILAIPKFRLEHACLLKSILGRIGITDLFDSDDADLSNMRKQKDLSVSTITHKAVIDINEQGTTASAATGVLLSGLSFKNTTEFVVNRPFVFYIVHEDSGSVLFYGKVFDMNGSIA